MGGVGNFLDKVNPVHKYTLGSKGLDVLGTGREKKNKKKDKEEAARLASSRGVEEKEPETPSAPKADVNASLLAKQGGKRRMQLLQQSTGRLPQGPSLNQNSRNRNLLG